MSDPLMEHGRLRRGYLAPFDVRLPGADSTDDEAIDTVVQPDLSEICDPGKLDDHGCLGAPDWIIEILSPSTAYKDQAQKFALYQSRRVTEYWVVNPGNEQVQAYVLRGNSYGKPAIYAGNERVKSSTGVVVDLADAFADWRGGLDVEQRSDRFLQRVRLSRPARTV